jgi:hypothetical protein
LKDQNPLDPLDNNQFTQQLVQFAQVEQQMKSNDQFASLVLLEKSAQATTALAYVGSTVVVDGATSRLNGGQARWTLKINKSVTATIVIKDDATGQNAYSGTFAVNPGPSASLGTATAMTASRGPPAATPSPPLPRMPTSNRSAFPPRSRRWSTRSISCRSRPAVDQQAVLQPRQDQADHAAGCLIGRRGATSVLTHPPIASDPDTSRPHQ